jgi:hypothetical protein
MHGLGSPIPLKRLRHAGNVIAAGAQAKTEYRNGMAAFVHQKGGLMAEMAVGGQKFGFEAQ